MAALNFDNDERVLCGDEWIVEATAIIKDVCDHVQEIVLSDLPVSLDNNDQHIYLNLTTKEQIKYCVELTAQGFRVVGNDYNRTDNHSEKYYETPYALLDNLSPLYRQAFGDSLVSKLQELHTAQSNRLAESSAKDDN